MPNPTPLFDLTKMSHQELIDYIKRLKAAPSPRITFKISDKGCVSMYGTRRMGVHFYASEWLTILDQGENLRAFIEVNRSKLAWKDSSKTD